MISTNSTCRICQGIKLTKVIDLGVQPLANAFLRQEDLEKEEPRFPLEVYLCADCHLAQLIHVVDKEILFRNYIYFSSGMPKLSEHFERYAEEVRQRFLPGPYDLVVEIGSNDGILLRHFKERGLRVLGIDPAENIAQVARERGVETVADFFTETLARRIASEKGQAKAILGNNVIAHINDYHDLCRGVKALLDPAGVFVFEAPYLVDMFEHATFDTIYHEHLNYLAVLPLQRLFALFDLEIFDAQTVSTQGQSIRVFAGHRGAHRVSASVAGAVIRERAWGLHMPEAYRELAGRIAANKERVINLIRQLKQGGSRLAAYGAPAKGNTLLNYYGLGAESLDFALDELPAKQNLYTPGTRLRVISREEAQRQQPNYYLLLAWNYRKVILEKEKDFLAAGGAFIMPSGELIRQNQSAPNVLTQLALADMPRTILVCGGAGFIGSHFIRHLYLTHPRYTIYNLDVLTYSGNKKNLADLELLESAKPLAERRYHFVYGDICDQPLLDHLLSLRRFDVVVNFAAESHVDRSLCSAYDFVRTNVVGVHTLIDACSRSRVPRFIQISTDEVYGNVLTGFSNEDAPLNPSSPYSASKASADVLVKSYTRSHNLPAVIVRGSNNFGPYQYPEKLIPLAITNLIEQKKIPVHGHGQHVRSWIHVLDFCEAIDLIMHRGEVGQIYNVAGTGKTNLEVLEAIWSALKRPGDLYDLIIKTSDRPGADLRYAPDDGKIRRLFGWTARRSFDDTIAQTVAWYRANEGWWREIKGTPTYIEHYKRQERASYF